MLDSINFVKNAGSQAFTCLRLGKVFGGSNSSTFCFVGGVPPQKTHSLHMNRCTNSGYAGSATSRSVSFSLFLHTLILSVVIFTPFETSQKFKLSLSLNKKKDQQKRYRKPKHLNPIILYI
jgi:hypothetical protein